LPSGAKVLSQAGMKKIQGEETAAEDDTADELSNIGVIES
jgi:hypothetical protein